jgi:uncharacterized membrane protein (UPF0127 family)
MRLHLGRTARGALFVLCGYMLSSCSALASGPSVELRGQRFDVELATDAAAQAMGLMFRDSMPAEHGMLFVFDAPQERQFWMKNCRMPLDILYFDEKYKLVSVQQRVPPCRSSGNDCPTYASNGKAQYVLELNAGTAEKLGAKPGDELKVTR